MTPVPSHTPLTGYLGLITASPSSLSSASASFFGRLARTPAPLACTGCGACSCCCGGCACTSCCEGVCGRVFVAELGPEPEGVSPLPLKSREKPESAACNCSASSGTSFEADRRISAEPFRINSPEPLRRISGCPRGGSWPPPPLGTAGWLTARPPAGCSCAGGILTAGGGPPSHAVAAAAMGGVLAPEGGWLDGCE